MLTPKQAHIGLKKPCKNCPFTADKANSILLSKGRREEIISDLMDGTSPTFQCHKTVKYGYFGGEPNKDKAQACAGAMAVVKQRGGMALIERMALSHGVIDAHYFDSAMALASDNFELGN